MMDGIQGQPDVQSIVARVKAILLKPVETWEQIDLEPGSVGSIYRSYVFVLAAIGPVCSLIGGQLFGFGGFGIVFRPSLMAALSSTIVTYILSLVMVYVLAVIIDALAPTFAGTPGRTQAFKVAAYASTASWVGGVFGLIPQLGILGIVAGLYSLYLLYLGLPRLMKVAQDKAVTYVVCVVLAAIVLFVVIGAITAAVTGMFASLPGVTSAGTTTGSVTVPGVGSVDLGKLEAASKQMEAAANSARAAPGTAGAVTTVPAQALQALLPATLSGLPRTSIESQSGGVAGLSGSRAEAGYGSGDNRIRLSVTDLGAAGAFAALGSAFNVESSKQDAGGYEKIGKVDGRMTTEKWRSESKSAEYSVLVGSRFMVEADGTGTDMDSVKAAVAGIDLAALEGLAK